MREVSLSELERMEEGSFVLIDTRSTDNVRYGMIPGAIHIPETELMENAEQYARELPPGKTLIVYCQRGVRSFAVSEVLADCGRECFSLAGGYLAWLRASTNKVEDGQERQKKAEDRPKTASAGNSISSSFLRLQKPAKNTGSWKTETASRSVFPAGKTPCSWRSCFRSSKGTGRSPLSCCFW